MQKSPSDDEMDFEHTSSSARLQADEGRNSTDGQQQLEDEDVAALLALARLHIDHGRPEEAMSCVVTALQATHGHEAAQEALHQQQQQERLSAFPHHQSQSEVVRRLMRFMELQLYQQRKGKEGITAVPDVIGRSENTDEAQRDEIVELANIPIIVGQGKAQILTDAWSDGSSFICQACGGLVAVKRRHAHTSLWCPALSGS